MTLRPSDGHAPTMMSDEALEQVRLDNPAARSLPVLSALAGGVERLVCLNLLDDQRLWVEVTPCRH